MRVAIIGQHDFGKAALEAFLARGDEVTGVFCAPEEPGGRPDPLRIAAEERRLKLFQFKSYATAEAHNALRSLDADIGVMAYVLIFAPQAFVSIPRYGMIQFHPSLLPLHRGPSSISWPIMQGRTKTGLTIFRPTDGLDEGPIILQKEVSIGPDDTLGMVYFEKIFPLGIEALLEAADLAVSGCAREATQDETQASYEGWVREAESRIEWAKPAEQVYNLIRGCNPSPGAWTTIAREKLYIYDAGLRPVHRFAEVKGKKAGQVVAESAAGFTVLSGGGFIDVLRVKRGAGKKIPASEANVRLGTILGL
jgi:methionyl-tRNA formyltransferase